MQRIQNTTVRGKEACPRDQTNLTGWISHANNATRQNMYLSVNYAESGYAKNAAALEESVSALT